jgi:hypothetical protein
VAGQEAGQRGMRYYRGVLTELFNFLTPSPNPNVSAIIRILCSFFVLSPVFCLLKIKITDHLLLASFFTTLLLSLQDFCIPTTLPVLIGAS